MSIKRVSLPTGITCTDWSHCGDLSQKRRCAHIVREDTTGVTPSDLAKAVKLPDGKIWRGPCALEHRIMCEEWLKVRPEDRMDALCSPSLMFDPPAVPNAPPTPASSGLLPRKNLPERPQEALRALGRPDLAWKAPDAVKPPSCASVSEADLQRLAQSGIEVEVRAADSTTIFVVAEHTGQDRLEVTLGEYGLIQSLFEVFPGASLVSLRRPPPAPAVTANERKFIQIDFDENFERHIARLDPHTGLVRAQRTT